MPTEPTPAPSILDQLRERLAAVPFRPFRIVLRVGRLFVVSKPTEIQFDRPGWASYRRRGSARGIRIADIAAIEPEPEPIVVGLLVGIERPKASGNGD